MTITKTRTTITSSLLRRASILTALGTASLALAAAGPAYAEPKNDPAKGCPVEDANGTVSYVPVGSRVGLFYCGADGEWHFGTVVNGPRAVALPPTEVPPVHRITATPSRVRAL